MAEDYSKYIGQIKNTKPPPTVTPEEQFEVEYVMPIYTFALQLKAAGVIDDVVKPTTTQRICEIHLKSTRFVIKSYASYSKHGEHRLVLLLQPAAYPRGFNEKHLLPSYYDNTQAIYKAGFEWITQVVVDVTMGKLR